MVMISGRSSVREVKIRSVSITVSDTGKKWFEACFEFFGETKRVIYRGVTGIEDKALIVLNGVHNIEKNPWIAMVEAKKQMVRKLVPFIGSAKWLLPKKVEEIENANRPGFDVTD